jgi:hypothetical protein
MRAVAEVLLVESQFGTFESGLNERLALLALELSELHNQDRFFHRQADEHHQAFG